MVVSAVSILFNFFLRLDCIWLTSKEGQATRTEQERSLFAKLSIAFIFNAVIIPIAVGFVLSLTSHDTLVDQTWYEENSIVAQAVLLLVFNTATDILKVLDPVPLFNRHVRARFVHSQSAITALFRPMKMRPGAQYSYALKTTALGLIYGPVYPLAYAITAGALVLSWICTRFALCHWYARPPGVDASMMMKLLGRLSFAVAVSLVVQVIATWAAMSKDAAALAATGPVLIGGPLLWASYAAFPLGRFKRLAVTSQLPSHQTRRRSADALDTGGVRFEDVTQLTGESMPLYECPLLFAGDLIGEGDEHSGSGCAGGAREFELTNPANGAGDEEANSTAATPPPPPPLPPPPLVPPQRGASDSDLRV